LESEDSQSAKVIGAAVRKKHEKKTTYCRSPISLYRTGCVTGGIGPNIFLMKGKTRRSGYTDTFIRNNVCALGSTIIVTDNAFITVDAWEKMTPCIIEGFRNINKCVAANPQWWLLAIFDGFSAHLLYHKENQEHLDANILSFKDEGDTSHVCQAYDKHVTKGDKAANARSISFMRSGFRVTKTIIDQWSLVNIGMYATVLDHNMSAQYQISFKTQKKEMYAPNGYLDLAMKPCSVTILKHMRAPDLSKRSVMQDCTGNGSMLNLTVRKLNQTGYVQRHCGLVNTEDRDALQLSQSVADISNEKSGYAAENNIELQAMYRALSPSTLTNLAAINGNPIKITKKEIFSILFSVFLILEEEKNKKEILVEILMKKIGKYPTKIPFEVVLPVDTVPAMPAFMAVGIAAALESPDVPAVQWDEDEASLFVGSSWDPTHTVVLCDMGDERPRSV
jgi:hypothetical protein